MVGLPEEIKRRLFLQVHKAARFVKNNFCFRQTIRQIMSSLNWKIPEEIIDESSAKFIQRIIYTKSPKSLYNKIKHPRTRISADYAPIVRAKSGRLERTPVHMGITNFNRLEPELRYLHPKKLKEKLKKKYLKQKKVS